MQKLILNIKDDSKMDILIQFLREINFIEILKIERSENSYKTNKFDSLFGIWKNRSVFISDLRKQAWGRNP